MSHTAEYYRNLGGTSARSASSKPSQFDGLGAFALDANGNVVRDESGNPVEATDYSAIGDLVTKGIALLNAQQVFQLNLSRLQQGLQPIPTQYAAPTLNLGVSGVNTQMLLFGALAIGALAMFAGKRR